MSIKRYIYKYRMFSVLFYVIVILRCHYNDEGDTMNRRTTFYWQMEKKEKGATHF
jgi:hypothetical protein